MRKTSWDMAKSIIVLSVIAVISGILLSVVYQLTIITEAELQRRISAKLSSIHASENGYESIEFDKGINPDITGFYGASGEDYYIALSEGNGYGGTLQMYVSFSGTSIVKLTPGSNGDTPGIREKALSEEYLKQYYIDISNAVFSFDLDGSFDKASGATYTSNGVLSAVKSAVTLYKNFLENKTAEEIRLEKLNTLYQSEGGWEKIKYSSADVTAIYKSNDDHYAVISNGKGYNRKGSDPKLELYVLLKDYKIINIDLGFHTDTSTIPNVGENLALKEEHLSQYYNIDFTNLTFNYNEGGNIDVVAGATRSTNGINEAVNYAIAAYKNYMGRA